MRHRVYLRLRPEKRSNTSLLKLLCCTGEADISHKLADCTLFVHKPSTRRVYIAVDVVECRTSRRLCSERSVFAYFPDEITLHDLLDF